MRRVFKRIAVFVLVLAVLPLAGYCALLAFNWRDRPPSTAAVQLRDTTLHRATVADVDNGYVFMMGFAADPNADPQVVGSARAAWARHFSAGQTLDGDPARPAVDLDRSRSASIRALASACQRPDVPCATALDEAHANVALWLDEETWLLDRYNALLARESWQEPAPLDLRVPLPSYSVVLEAQQLMHVFARQLARDGDSTRVRELLERDIRFWRQTLSAANLLTTKMVAVTALRRHFEFGNLIMRELPSSGVASAMPGAWHEEISATERSLLRSLAAEWLYLDGYVRETKRASSVVQNELWWRVLSPLLQPQDSSNTAAEALTALATELNAPYPQFTAALQRVRERLRADQRALAPLTLYNTVGTLLAFTAPADYSAYAARVADVEGIRRAALLTATLRAEGVHESQLATRIAQATLRDPYDSRPFEWDARAHAIVFTGLESTERAQHLFVY